MRQTANGNVLTNSQGAKIDFNMTIPLTNADRAGLVLKIQEPIQAAQT